MDLLTKLERRFGSWAIPNLAVYLIVLQSIGVVLLMGDKIEPSSLLLHGRWILDRGEWWRLVSFMMLPRTMSPLWLFFAFYIFYMIGNSLEQHWGTFRFNLFVFSGYFLTIIMAFISPEAVITNTYFLGCVFLAFATLFPHIEFRLFFILPVKVKWLGWLTVALYTLTLLGGDIGSRLCVVAAYANYLLFFGKGIIHNLKAGRRKRAYVADSRKAAAQARHTCAKCGITDQADELMHFRYCSTCGECFCEDHISDHEHAS